LLSKGAAGNSLEFDSQGDRLKYTKLSSNTENPRATILVTGASGFIGSRVVKRLLAANTSCKIRCMTRNTKALSHFFGETSDRLEIVNADVQNYSDLIKVMRDVDIAYYLIHSMEGSSKEWKKFAERDRVAAENFSRAVSASGILRVIYLGGLTHGKEIELSEHMRSRIEVGEILKKSTAEVTIFRAAIILGQGGRIISNVTISC
jgi:uncharacterized protein YbjT (DUF2867 family)